MRQTIDPKPYMQVQLNQLRLDYAPELNLQPYKPIRDLPPYEDVSKMYLDIETLGLNPQSDRIIAVGIMIDGQEPVLITNPDERSLLVQVQAYLADNKPRLLIGHNHITFDLPFLMKRGRKHRVLFPFRVNDYRRKITSSSCNGKPIEYKEVIWNGVSIIDTYHQAGIYDKIYATLSSYGLKNLAIHIGARDERRLELSHTEIKDCWKSGKIEPILQYLRYDLEDTRALSDFFIPSVYYQRAVVPMPLQQIAVSSPAKKWERILEHYYKDTNHPEPDEACSYDGGYCSVNEGLYENCYKIDVSSMYPSIQLTYGLCSLKDKDKYYLSVLRYLRDERYKLKKLAKQTGEAKYDAMQNAYKVLINGGYGFSGTRGYPYNCYRTAALVTAYGRLLIQLMIDEATNAGAKIVEVDTDGIILSGGDAQSVFQRVQSALPKGIEIDLDWTHVDVYAPKIKNYLMIHPDGKVKAKGLFRKRNRSRLKKEFPIDYIKAYLKSPEEAQALYHHLRERIETGTCSLDYLSITENIAKSAKKLVEHGIGKPGDKVTYYVAEQERFHKTTHKQLKSMTRPVAIDSCEPYWTCHYLTELDELKSEIDTVIAKGQS